MDDRFLFGVGRNSSSRSSRVAAGHWHVPVDLNLKLRVRLALICSLSLTNCVEEGRCGRVEQSREKRESVS